MMEDSDTAAVARAQAGDQDAFRVLVERHSHALFRLAFRMTGNVHDAEDIVQETFLRAYRQLAKFQSRASVGTWLHRIAANCALDLLRKRKRQDQHCEPAESMTPGTHIMTLPAKAPTPDQIAFNTEVGRHLELALDQLTPMERAAFVLRHFEHQPIEEIGSALHVGQSAAKQAIFRAVQKVRRSLEPILSVTK